ncbi:pro-resilin-like isoform X2 [Cloeon dipterum]|uniref:pro-resilin-like isoform X2 n=1 Tax=Cloeon dipterum TaxID=197152 RepID=UPI00321FF8F4
MRLAFVCIAAMVGVALAKPQGYDFPSRNSGNGYDNNDRQGFGGSGGGGGGGYPDSTDRNNYRQGNNGYPSTRPSRPRFQQSSTTTRNPFSASPSGYGGQLGGTGFGDRFPSRGQQFANNNGGFSSTTNRPVDQQQPFAGNFDRVTNTGFGGSGPSGFGANNPAIGTTARPIFPDSINSQLPDSPSVNTNFAGNTGFVNSAVNTGRPVSNNVPFGNNNGPSSFSRPNNNNGFGNGVTRPFTGNSNNNRPFNSNNNNNDRFGNNNNNNNRPFGGGSNNNRPFGGSNNNGGFGNNNNGFGGGNGGNTGFGNGGNNGFGGGNNGFGSNSNNINSSPTDDLSEPANYEFSYEVNDPPSGQNFGHTERRQNDDTVGSYFVLLPDGRLQRVEYTAGVGGYRARVTYEDQGGQLRK